MFISIRWKAIVLLSIMLFVITFSWVARSLYVNLENYQQALVADELRFQNILEKLINDNFLHLSQYAQLISDYEFIKNADLPNKGEVVEEQLSAKWFDLNLRLGVDYVAVLDSEGNRISSAHQFPTAEANQRFTSATSLFVYDLKKNNVQNFVFCDQGCSQLATEPFFFANGDRGFIVIGQNMSELVGRYQAITGVDLAMIMEKPSHLSQSQYLSAWQSQLWAASQYEITFDLLQQFSVDNKNLKNIYFEDSIWAQWEDEYRINKLIPANYFQVGYPLSYINIIDNKAHQSLLKTELINQILAGLIAWLFAVTLIVLALLGPIKRIMRVVNALALLPKQHYQEAKNTIQTSKHKIHDEITELETTTIDLSDKLEALDYQIDVSKQKLQQQILTVSRSKDFLQRLFDNANLYILMQDSLYSINQSNAYFDNHFAEIPHNAFTSLLKDEQEKRTLIKNGVLLLSGEIEAFQQETWLKNHKQEDVYVTWTHTLVEDENGHKQILSIGIDITQRKKDEHSLKWLADNDSLTKIGNRRTFHARLQALLDSNRHGAIVFIDVNRFKQINDIYGHVVGDQVLIEIAQHLKSHVREHDTVCRLAGDEFTLLLPDINRIGLESILSDLAQRISGRLIMEDGRGVDYTASFGAALFPEHGDDEQSLIVHSDMAMYQAKRKGLNHWHIFDFSDDSLQSLKEEHHLMNIIRKALKKDRFKMEYQPIMHIKSCKVSHYEALVRLTDKEGNALSPADFIPVAERVGLINELDFWVFTHVMQFIAELPEEQKQLRFSVNISAPSLQDVNFARRVIGICKMFSINPKQLIIELTETAYIDSLKQVSKNLEYLHDQGFAIALDDFGVGFSSFSYMTQLPLTYIKLDGAYIQELHKNQKNRAFIESVVIMASAFGMQTIAEFVQSEADLRVLEEIGVDYAQGYLVGMSQEPLMDEETEYKLQTKLLEHSLQ